MQSLNGLVNGRQEEVANVNYKDMVQAIQSGIRARECHLFEAANVAQDSQEARNQTFWDLQQGMLITDEATQSDFLDFEIHQEFMLSSEDERTLNH